MKAYFSKARGYFTLIECVLLDLFTMFVQYMYICVYVPRVRLIFLGLTHLLPPSTVNPTPTGPALQISPPPPLPCMTCK